MRILVISNLFPPAFLGGYEIGASWVCAEFKRRGHEIMLWTASAAVDGRRAGFRILPQPREEKYRWLSSGPCFYGIDVLGGLLLQNYDLTYEPVRKLLFDFLRNYPDMSRQRQEAIEDFLPELVLAFNPACILDPVFAELARIPRLTQVPTMAIVSDDWPLRWHDSHPLVHLWRRWQALKIGSPNGDSEIDQTVRALGDWMDQNGIFAFAASPDYTNAVFTSQHLFNKCRPATLHKVSTRVVHWGLPGVATYPRATGIVGVTTRPLRLAYCGQLQPHKGLIRILQAMRRTRRACSLLVVGDDTTDYARYCHAYIEETRLAGRVDFTGKIPAEAVAPLLAGHADMLVLPSLNGGSDGFEEPFSIVLLQAMAMGLAVAASRTGGSVEAFVEGEGGRFFDPDQPEEIVRLIDELEEDRDQLRILGLAARACVEDRFTIEGMVDQLLEVANSPRIASPRLIYAVRHATTDPANSGCVRVARRLGRLIEGKVPVTFATWSTPVEGLLQLRADQAEVLGRFNGPRQSLGIAPEQDVLANPTLRARHIGGWIILPEVMPATECLALIAYARRHRLRIAAIFHDAIALLRPEFCNAEIRDNHAAYMRALADCDLILPNSDFSRQCLLTFWQEENVTPTHLRTVQLSGEFVGARIATGEPPPLTAVARVLCVSTMEPRKNHLRLLAALEHLPALCPGIRFELNLVGNRYAGAPEITRAVETAAASDDRITWWGVVDDQKLRELYTEAHYTIYPSLIEGFGLPILESIWHERPCICSDRGVMAELAAGGGCLATNVQDELCLAQALMLLATDQELRHRLTLEAARRPLKTWEQYAREVLDLLYHFPP